MQYLKIYILCRITFSKVCVTAGCVFTMSWHGVVCIDVPIALRGETV